MTTPSNLTADYQQLLTWVRQFAPYTRLYVRQDVWDRIVRTFFAWHCLHGRYVVPTSGFSIYTVRIYPMSMWETRRA